MNKNRVIFKNEQKAKTIYQRILQKLKSGGMVSTYDNIYYNHSKVTLLYFVYFQFIREYYSIDSYVME